MTAQKSPKISEAEIIAGCLAGDQRAFETLYNLHKRRVYSICLRMVDNVAEAEDLTQEAFMQLFRRISTYTSESALSSWLQRLTIDVVLTHLRKKGLKEVSLDQETEHDAQHLPKGGYRQEGLSSIGTVWIE